MNDTKIISLFVVTLAAAGLWLHGQRKLMPVITVAFSPSDKGSIPLSRFAIAFLLYVFVLSFLDPQDGLYLTIVVILGALLVNSRMMGQNDLFHTVLDK